MQIDPMVVNSFFAEPRLAEPSAGGIFEGGSQTLPPQPQTSDTMTALQSQFDSLMKELNKELGALEKRFSAAIKQLAKNCQPAGGVSGAAPSKPQAPNRQRYEAVVSQAAQRNEIDPALINSVIHQESGFDPHARSSAGAMGLMQLMPETAKALGVRDPFDPAQNVEGGTRLLRQLLDRYSGKLDLALAAYNAGLNAVDKYGGVPPYEETQNYVRSILTSYRASALAS